jgi:hypothetical protein
MQLSAKSCTRMKIFPALAMAIKKVQATHSLNWIFPTGWSSGTENIQLKILPLVHFAQRMNSSNLSIRCADSPRACTPDGAFNVALQK